MLVFLILAAAASGAVFVQRAIDGVNQQNLALQDRLEQLQGENSRRRAENDSLAAQLQSAESELAHPTLAMWTSCGGPCIMSGAHGWRAAGVPDTFDLLTSFTATVPVAVYFLTLDQYVQFASCGGSLRCVSGDWTSYSARTTLSDAMFTLAEGCSAYMVVFQSSVRGTITPNVRLKYNPAAQLTGVCQQGEKNL